MKLFNNKTLSVLFVAGLLTFTSSCKIYVANFLREGYISLPPKESGTFIIKTDGTKISGKEIGIRIPGKLRLDDVGYSHNDIKAFQSNGVYHIRDRKHYLRSIYTGKLNFYVSAFNTDQYSHYYAQKGENGEIKLVSSFKDLAEFVSDCPVIYEKLNRSNREIKQIYKENKYFISEALIEYNKTCGQ